MNLSIDEIIYLCIESSSLIFSYINTYIIEFEGKREKEKDRMKLSAKPIH